MPPLEEKHQLRRSLKSQRRALSKKHRLAAALALARQARAHRQLFRCQRILAYSPILGEIDPGPLLASMTARVYLPRIVHFHNRTMRFFETSHGFKKNTLGINEPLPSKNGLPAKHFDAVLLPLVAFDRHGNRLGMGAGFYDRSFSFRSHEGKVRRPFLIGLAHNFQEVKSLPTDVWDVRLDAIITDRELIQL